MTSQPPIRTVEFGGFPTDPWLRVNGHRYGIGERFEGKYGFEYGTVLSERLFSILVALAVARMADPDPDGGWLSADELAMTIDNEPRPGRGGDRRKHEHDSSGEVLSATPRRSRPLGPSEDGTGKFLWRVLRGYYRDLSEEIALTRNPDTHLIQYERVRKIGTVLAHGRMGGPYRLGVARDAITLDRDRALGVRLPSEPVELDEALCQARRLALANDYVAARGLLLAGLFGPAGRISRDDLTLVGTAHHLLSHYAVQLGMPEDAIRSARRARRLYADLRDPVAVTSTLITESHAESQLGQEVAALDIARQAAGRLENASPARRRLLRLELLGVFGQRYARLRRFPAAERNLLNALHMAEDAGDAVMICRAVMRRAENFMGERNLSAAERALCQAHEIGERYPVRGPETPVLWRITAGFMVSAGRWDEAARWTQRAKNFALDHRLGNELKRLQSMIAAIVQSGVSTVV